LALVVGQGSRPLLGLALGLLDAAQLVDRDGRQSLVEHGDLEDTADD
jgi:hypothetical protein